jgi:hypothetical protein
MSFFQVWNDPSVQKLLLLLVAAIGGWAGNQLPALQGGGKLWRLVKLIVEVALMTVVLSNWSEVANKVASGEKLDPTVAQSVSTLYLLLGVLLLGLIGFDLYQLWRKPVAADAIAPDPELARKQKFRRAVMDKVGQKWFGLVESPVYRQAQMDLGLEMRPDLLRFAVQGRGQESRRMLPPGRKLMDEFRSLGEGGALLILGAAGAGKTTQLIELAIALIAETDAANLEHPLPVLLNISSWGRGRRQALPSLEEWLVEEMNVQYGARREAGLAWLKEDDLVLLLDGLDEVAAERRNDCVAAINVFQRQHGTVRMVLCSRMGDFEALTTELEQFQTAVMIQPLAEAQVEEYLQRAGLPLAGVRSVLMDDNTDDDETRGAKAELREMARQPLFLWILALAYRDRSAAALLGLEAEERRSVLFGQYVAQMFVQRPLDERGRRQMVEWLGILARRMGAEKEFLIERIQPGDWLRRGRLKWQYRLVCGLVCGLIGGLIGALTGALIGGLFFGLIVGLLFGLIDGLSGGLIGRLDNIDPVERLEISMSHFVRHETLKQLRQQLISGLIGGLFFGLIVGLLFGLIVGLIVGLASRQTTQITNLISNLSGLLIIGLFGGLFFGLIVGLIVGLICGLIGGLKTDITIDRAKPNQGIWNSRNNMLFTGGFALGFTVLLYFFLSYTSVDKSLTSFVLFMTGFLVWAAVSSGGGKACIQHFALHLVLHRAHQIPWNFVTFFQSAQERLFIQSTGGSYVFVHRYLQDYFAENAPLD